jgi:hypothetical protein
MHIDTRGTCSSDEHSNKKHMWQAGKDTGRHTLLCLDGGLPSTWAQLNCGTARLHMETPCSSPKKCFFY